ncbi:AzlD domain-containing protein [Nocardioides bruguierae]|uniref:AzlD domain-containing protein n=1 Tax=Nocardioides bruguierae TaxID=2945102 RepID=A0A9X2DAP8_9ACTN|nr:AzlD domain-containing protein [Nocardioides bruguierae]MCM0622220.1 AzlD domain-containing protein [Nocardioides bruguierae]
MSAAWAAVLVGAAGCWLLKVLGLSVPARWLARPRVAAVAALLPVALLAALVAVQTAATSTAEGPALALDARLAGLGAAALLLLVRAPFLVVVVGGAATAALLRLA